MKGKVNPMCRTVFSALIISLSIANPLFGQTPMQETQPPDLSQFLQLSPWNSLKSFKTMDNTQISNKEGFSMLNTAPANQTLMRQMRNLYITNNIGMITISASAIGSALIVLQLDINKPSTLLATLLTATIGTGVGYLMMLVSHNAYQRKLAQSVNNYNLYIMGIPIPH
jgi:heme oxygenase